MPTPLTLPTNIAAGGTTSGHKAHSDTAYGALNTITTGTYQQTKTASYTLVLSDAGEVIEMNSASATTLTVPPNSSVAFPAGTPGTVIEVYRMGAGTVTLVPGAGVTLTVPTGSPLTLRVQGSTASLRKRATNEWVVSGDIG